MPPSLTERLLASRSSNGNVLTVANIDEPILVRRSDRARRLTLKVDEAKRSVILTVPPHASLKDARHFAAQHVEWLERRLAAMPKPIPFTEDAVMPLRGYDHRIRFAGRDRSRGVVWTEDGQSADQTPTLCVSGERAHAPRRLRDWLKREARKDFSARVAWHAGRLGLSPKRISVRDQSTRWGSCSSSGALSFSWRLVLAPHFILDYVAAHEVAHLKEMNHRPAFWRLVRQTMPRTDEARSWLKRHGAELYRYGAER